MKKIAVVESFFEPHHKQQIEAAAAKYGYAVDYYLDGVLPKERAGEGDRLATAVGSASGAA